MSETGPTWRTSDWIGFVLCVLLGAAVVLLVAAGVAVEHTGGCQPPPDRVVRDGLLWLTVVVVAAPVPWAAVAVRSAHPARWVVAALVNLSPALLMLLVYGTSDTHQFFCIPF